MMITPEPPNRRSQRACCRLGSRVTVPRGRYEGEGRQGPWEGRSMRLSCCYRHGNIAPAYATFEISEGFVQNLCKFVQFLMF